MYTQEVGFPSPIGVLYILIRPKIQHNNAHPQIVSVPYRGSLYSNFMNEKQMKQQNEWFPSPIGVLYILINIRNITRHAQQLFPSPIGVLYILIDAISHYKAIIEDYLVSVPYRGSLYSNKYKKTLYKIQKVFPSPIGVLYILIG